MSKLKALVCGLVLAAAGPSTGQEARPTELSKVSQIIGSSVLLQDGVNYGKVQDIVLNEDGCIEYVVVSREERYALMPWAVARFDYGQRALIFNVTPQVVQPLFFARDAWPNVADPVFGRRVRDAFGPSAVRREVRRESVRPEPDTPQPSEQPKAKAKAKEKGTDAPQPGDQPKAKAKVKEKGPDPPPPTDQPKAKTKEKGSDAPQPGEQPKVKAKQKGSDSPQPGEEPKAEAKPGLP
jgi:sporulation protein YlmC with PRC-barrel domain